MSEHDLENFAVVEKLSRRSLVAGATFFGAAMAAIGEVAKAKAPAPGATAMPRLLCPTATSLRKPARSKSAPSGSHAPCERDRP